MPAKKSAGFLRLAAEVMALRRLWVAAKKLRLTAPVDDDFPKLLHELDQEIAHYEKKYGDPQER